MTVWDVFGLWRRQWPVVLVCLGIIVAGVWSIRQAPVVYWASTSVVLRPPYLRDHLAPLGRNAIPFAGVVEQRLNAGLDGPPAVSPDVSIVDRGLYDGWVANVPNYGGQWANDFTRPMIVVQASGPNPQIVRQRIADVTARIRTIVADLQDEQDVPATARVDLLLLPPTTVVTASGGPTPRAYLAAGAVGALLLVIAPFAVDRLTRRSRRLRRRTPAAADPA